MLKNYILVGQTPVPEDDPVKWVEFFQDVDNRRVALTKVKGMEVSTIFLGMDHRFVGDGPPILFETMVFKENSNHDEFQWRYCTWKEAEEGHRRVVQAIKNKENLSKLDVRS